MTERLDEMIVERDGSLDLSRIIVWRDGATLGGGGSDPSTGGNGQAMAATPILVPAGINADPGDVRDVFVRWNYVATQVREGQYGFLHARLNRSVNAEVAVNIAVTGGTASANDYTLSNTTLRFPAGQLQASCVFTATTAGGSEGEETVELTLTPAGDLTFPIDGSAPYRVGTDPAWGDHIGLVRIIDVTTPVTPTWRWTVGNALTVPETIGTIPIQISLDATSTTPINIRVQSANISGGIAAGVNYVRVDRVVVIPAGQLVGQFDLTIIDDPAAVVGPNLQFSLTGTSLGANCLDPGSPVLVIDIVDDDLVATTRQVQWTVASVPQIEPATVAGQLAVALVATVDSPFAAETDIPVTVTSSGPVLGGNFGITWQPGVANGFIRFSPQQGVAAIRFTVFAPSAGFASRPGTVELALQDGSTWDLGTNDTLTVVIQAAGATEPTQLAVKRGIRTGRTLVEGLVAVVPPSATLPRYNIAGEDCQVIGHARTSEGLFDSAWVTGFAAGDIDNSAAAASYPGVGTPLELLVGAGSTPAESGVFPSAAWQDIKFRLKPCNVGGRYFERALSASLSALPGSAEPQQWEGPSGALFEQVGADLRRTFYFRVWLRDTNDSEDDDEVADPLTRCCLVECWLTHYAVDAGSPTNPAVVVVEGRLANTAWDKTADPYVEGPKVDGPVNFRSFDVTDIPSGWDVVWGTANFNESYSTPTATLVPSRATAYHLPPTAQMPFRFAMYRASDTTSAEAQRILRYQQNFVATGAYGVTRNRVYGEQGDPLIDHGRAGYNKSWGPTADRQGWRGVFHTTETKAGRYRTPWASGSGQWDTMPERIGWMQSKYDRSSYATGGDGIPGMTGALPSAGYCEITWFELAMSMMRTRLDAQDVLTGDQCWQHILVEENGGVVAPWLAGGEDRIGLFRNPQFNTTAVAGTHIFGAPSGTWCLAPTTRAWNVPTPEVSADPNAADVNHEAIFTGFEQVDAAHSSRMLWQARDGWWACRSPLAYRQFMTMAAWVSRAFSAHPVTTVGFPGGAGAGAGDIKNSRWAGSMNDILVRTRSLGAPSKQGGYYVGPEYYHWSGVDNSRRWAWVACIMAGAHAIGSPATRAALAPVTGINHWFEKWADFFDYVSTEFGSVSQRIGSGSPVPYEVSQFGPTTQNALARTGAFPSGPTGSNVVTTGPWAGHWFGYCLSYMERFRAMAASAVIYRGLHSYPQRVEALRRILRYSRYQREAARAWWGGEGGRCFPMCQPTTLESNPLSGVSQTIALDAPPSLATFLTGSNWWDIPDTGNFLPMVALSVYEYRDSGDPEHLRTFQTAINREADDLEDAFAVAYADWLNKTNGSDGSGQFVSMHYLHQFTSTWLAEALNRIS